MTTLPRVLVRATLAAGVLPALLLTGALVQAQSKPATPVFELPPGATSLQGTANVRVETTDTATSRKTVEATDPERGRLNIRLKNGQFFWGTDTQPLKVERAGDFIYLSSAEPGKYVRIRRVNDKLTYVEHVDMGTRSVTWWGELKVVLGR